MQVNLLSVPEKIRLEELNQNFDDLKMQGDWNEMLKFLLFNKKELEKFDWKVDTLIQQVLKIMTLIKDL